MTTRQFSLMSATLALALAAVADGTVPTVPSDSITLEQDKYTRKITVSYTLANGPAIVTASFATNGVALPAEFAASQFLEGDVDKVVDATDCSFTWDARGAWPDQKVKDFSVRLTARAVDDPPDYMVVDLMPNVAERVRYFNSTNDFPGGLFGNPAYRTTQLVMRRIRMKNVPWIMGSAATESGRTAAEEAQHVVTFTNDYWFSIFPVTQAQYTNALGAAFSFNYKVRGDMRPADKQSIARLRQNAGDTINTSYHYPNPPHPDSFIGKLRSRTGIAFDLPGEAQWECACRAGVGSSQWNTGVYFNKQVEHAADKKTTFYRDDGLPGRYQVDCVWNESTWAYVGWSSSVAPDDGGTTIVGSYAPNAWGIYDMHGNVWEAVLDYKQNDITGPEFAHGEINANGANMLNGTVGSKIIWRGGNCGNNGHWDKARCAYRGYSIEANTATAIFGFRVICYGTLK